MKNVINLLLICFISLAATSSYAATVNGTLTVGGTSVFVPDDGNRTITLNNDVVATGALGDVIGTLTGTLGMGGVEASLDSFIPVNDFFVVDGWTLDLTSLAVIDGANFLNLEGAGVLTGHGFEATEAIWSFSAEIDTSYSMEVTAAGIPAVPVPAAIWLFGSGLIGLIGVARRKV